MKRIYSFDKVLRNIDFCLAHNCDCNKCKLNKYNDCIIKYQQKELKTWKKN